MYRGRTEFSSTRWRNTWFVAFFVVAALVAVLYSRTFPFSWISVFFIGFSIVGFISVLESITDYIVLGENEIVIRKTFRKTNLIRDDIEKVSWEKGTGVSIRVKGGKWVKIPTMGNDPEGLANSLRNWSRNTGKAD